MPISTETHHHQLRCPWGTGQRHQPHRTFRVGSDPQGSWSPALTGAAHTRIGPTTCARYAQGTARPGPGTARLRCPCAGPGTSSALCPCGDSAGKRGSGVSPSGCARCRALRAARAGSRFPPAPGGAASPPGPPSERGRRLRGPEGTAGPATRAAASAISLSAAAATQGHERCERL